MATRDLLEPPVQRCVEQHQAHLVDFVVRGTPSKQVFEVYIDNETGVTSDLCAEVSRSLIDVIDRTGAVTGTYRLDVSSPGIDRPLRFPWQFRKHTGRLVEVHRRTVSGEQAVRGTLVSCDDTSLVVQERSATPGMVIPLGEVIDIRVHAPW